MLRALTFAALLGVPAAAVAQQPCTSDARLIVDQLYRTVLERSPNPQPQADYARRLRDGSATVKDLVRELATSPEHNQRFVATGNADANQRTVATLYRHILGREVDPQGMQTFTDVIARQGAGAVITALMDSDEYRQKFADNRVPGRSTVEYCGALGTSGRFGRNNGAVGTSGVGGYTAGSEAFDRLDRNRDGRITRNEWNGTAAEFDRIDTNRNNVLTPAEFEATVSNGSDPNGEVTFRSLDRNGDGRITINEWNWNRRTFDRQDTNADGAISPWEFRGAPGGRDQ